jgi:hypothetical protein
MKKKMLKSFDKSLDKMTHGVQGFRMEMICWFSAASKEKRRKKIVLLSVVTSSYSTLLRLAVSLIIPYSPDDFPNRILPIT